jgi:hypothetical protein
VSRLGGSLDRDCDEYLLLSTSSSGQDDDSDHIPLLDLIRWYRKHQRTGLPVAWGSPRGCWRTTVLSFLPVVIEELVLFDLVRSQRAPRTAAALGAAICGIRSRLGGQGGEVIFFRTRPRIHGSNRIQQEPIYD